MEQSEEVLCHGEARLFWTGYPPRPRKYGYRFGSDGERALGIAGAPQAARPALRSQLRVRPGQLFSLLLLRGGPSPTATKTLARRSGSYAGVVFYLGSIIFVVLSLLSLHVY